MCEWNEILAKVTSVCVCVYRVKDYVDFTTPINPHHTQLPYCHNDFEQSEKTLSHLTVSFICQSLLQPSLLSFSHLFLFSLSLSFLLYFYYLVVFTFLWVCTYVGYYYCAGTHPIKLFLRILSRFIHS